MPKTNDLNTILAELASNAATPFEQADSLTPQAYLNQDFCQLEVENIFRQEWVCVGRTVELAEAGDYITSEIGEQQVFTIKDTKGGIRSFSNVCLHRMMTLLTEKKGNCKRVVCPYHAWSYRIDGTLIGAPDMDKRPGFKAADNHLPELATEIWEGFIYVSLSKDPVSIKERMKPLQDVVETFDMARYVQIDKKDDVWDCNWKCLAENFMESYHLFQTHSGTIGPFAPKTEMEYLPGTEHLNYHVIYKDEHAPLGRAMESNTRVKGKWRNATLLVTLYPSHLIAVAPDYYWYLSLQPCGADKVNIRYGLSIAPEVLDAIPEGHARDVYIKDTVDFFDRVNEEDRYVVEGIHKGAKSPLVKSGPLCHLELSNYEFYQYLAKKLVSE